jgi:hypothetical protein
MPKVKDRHARCTMLPNKNPQAARSVLRPLFWCLAPVPPTRDHLNLNTRQQRRRRRPFRGHNHWHETCRVRALPNQELNRLLNLGDRSPKRRNHHSRQRITLTLRDQLRIGRRHSPQLGSTWRPDEFVDPSDVGSVREAATQLGQTFI